MSFYYLEQPTDYSFENFDNLPTINMGKSDNNFQCSDNVQITGNMINSVVPNSSLDDCKGRCATNNSCIGFDFNQKNSSCSLKNTITDLSKTMQNNVMCVKKISKCKTNTKITPTENLSNETINWNINSQESETSANIPQYIDPQEQAHEIIANNNQPSSMNIPIPSSMNTPSSMNNPSNKGTIYVDLPCYLNKMDILKNHSDNMMVDLQLLITNLKACSYIRKPETTNSTQGKIVNELPTADTIKIYNTPATVLYTNNPNQLLGVSEPFECMDNNNNSFLKSFIFRVIVLLIILIFIMHMK